MPLDTDNNPGLFLLDLKVSNMYLHKGYVNQPETKKNLPIRKETLATSDSSRTAKHEKF